MAVYDEWICVCKPSRTKSKNISVLKQSRPYFVGFSLIQFSPLTPKYRYRWFMLSENQKEPPSDKGKWRSGRTSDIWMPENFVERYVHGNCRCCCHCQYMVRTCKLSTMRRPVRRTSFLNICPEHDIRVQNNQIWPDLEFPSWSKFDTFTLRETWCFIWMSNQGWGVTGTFF